MDVLLIFISILVGTLIAGYCLDSDYGIISLLLVVLFPHIIFNNIIVDLGVFVGASIGMFLCYRISNKQNTIGLKMLAWSIVLFEFVIIMNLCIGMELMALNGRHMLMIIFSVLCLYLGSITMSMIVIREGYMLNKNMEIAIF